MSEEMFINHLAVWQALCQVLMGRGRKHRTKRHAYCPPMPFGIHTSSLKVAYVNSMNFLPCFTFFFSASPFMASMASTCLHHPPYCSPDPHPSPVFLISMSWPPRLECSSTLCLVNCYPQTSPPP